MNDRNYETKENMICCGESASEESLTRMMDDAACMATDALLVARRM